MAKHPLQPGDVSPDFATHDTSEAGDRREQVFRREGPRPLMPYPTHPCPSAQVENVENAAPSHKEAQDFYWAPGQQPTDSYHRAPFEEVHFDSGAEDEVVDINIRMYGDPLDPTSPMRVRDVSSQWKVDTDEDGHKN